MKTVSMKKSIQVSMRLEPELVRQLEKVRASLSRSLGRKATLTEAARVMVLAGVDKFLESGGDA